MKNAVKYIYFVSLGCSKNFVDTEVMAGALIKHNFGISNNKNQASIFVINTCAFIPPAREEALTHIQDAIKWKKKGSEKKIIVTGCLTQWDKKKDFIKQYPEVDLWLGISEIPKLPERILSLYENKLGSKVCKSSSFYLYDEKTPRLQLTPDHYAFIKIAEGCNNCCSYCAIPSIRGPLRSRSKESIIKEAKNLISANVKELIIIAQDITAFGKDKKNSNHTLAKLIEELDALSGNHWIRLHYLHPEGITDELVSVLKDAKHVIPYLDIPIQHISEKILKLMNRKIDQKNLLKILTNLRNNITNLAMRTTLLVGFPGETNKEFKELEKFVTDWKFERLGVFPFYPEQGTKAFSMPKQIPFNIAEERAAKIRNIHAENSLNFNSSLVDKEFNVIVDSVLNNYAVGRTYMDSPQIDNTVIIPGSKKIKAGIFVRVKIKKFSAFELEAARSNKLATKSFVS